MLVGGLAVGMAACMLLLEYVSYELSFDHFHTRADRIYRVINERFVDGKPTQKSPITYPPVGAAMAEEFPEIANHTRLKPAGDIIVRLDDKIAEQKGMYWADAHFFEIFDFPILAQKNNPLLDVPNELAISRSVAAAYFPGAKGDFNSIIGKDLFLGADDQPYKIAAVFENTPDNSLLQFQVLGSFATLISNRGKEKFDSWKWSDFYHFVELKPGTAAAMIEAKLPAFCERHFQGATVTGSTEVLSLQALKDAHLYSKGLEYEIGETTNGRAVWSLLIIAFFILVIAWINYVNLASVRAMERSKEVGVRKVIGANRAQLIGQFMMEAMLVNGAALALAVLAIQVIKPWFAANFGLKPDLLTLLSGTNTSLLLAFGGMMLTGVIISAAYPAWLLSASPVAGILKGFFQKNLGGGGLRKILVVFQFTASIALITGTWLVSRQITYMNQQDLGVTIDHVITIDPPQMTNWDSTYISRLNTFKNTLTTNPNIRAAASSNRSPGDPFLSRIFQIQKSGDGGGNQAYTCGFINADYQYAATYGLQPLAGRFFRENDHNPDWDRLENIVLTESAVKMFGFPSNEAAIQQGLRFWDHNWHIVGVLPDFHQKSLHTAIEPLLFIPSYSNGNKISVRVAGDNLDQTLAFAKKTYLEFFPGNVFQYTFVADDFQKLYAADVRFGNILGFFTLLTILIACLGLFGLASYTTILRTKEIGIRKVLGASVAEITGLLAKDFLKLVVIAVLIASPLAYLFIQQWLADFAYRVDVPWWIFAGAGLAAVSIAFLTVGFQSVKAALMNPVKSLRNE